MSRGLFSLKSLDRYAITYVIGILMPVSILLSFQLIHSWRTYDQTVTALESLERVRMTLESQGANLPQATALSASDGGLESVEQDMRRFRAEAKSLLLVTVTISGLLLLALFWGFGQFRRRVIRPFVEATYLVKSLAEGNMSTAIPQAPYRGEICGLFDAIRVLKENTIAKTQLEDERDRLIDSLAVMAETDFLTGLLNRRAFQARADATCATALEPGQCLALILFDLDHFKRVNDAHGHDVGDRALMAVGDACRRTWRQADLVARIGGEEFAALCVLRDTEQAEQLAERMRRSIERMMIPLDDDEVITISASFGVAVGAGQTPQDFQRLFKAADNRLYRAKAAGRNRVMTEPVAITG